MVFGNGIYHEESSICVAAQFEGLLTTKEFGVNVVTGQDSYTADTKNGVTSNKAYKSELAFKFDMAIVKPVKEFFKGESVEIIDGPTCYKRVE